MLLLQREGTLQERLHRLQAVGPKEGFKRQRAKEERPIVEHGSVSRPHERATPEVASAVVATQQQKDTPVGNKEASCLEITVPVCDDETSCLGVMDPADCNETVSV